MDHISLSDPLTWVGVFVASLLIAGLRVLMRGRARTPPESAPIRDEAPPPS
jgi:hypothetical protein